MSRVTYSGGPVSIPDQFVWHFHWTKWQWCVFFSEYLGLRPLIIIPALLHTHSFIYHTCCIMFLSQYFSFLLSVSFHKCFMLVRSRVCHKRCTVLLIDSIVKKQTFFSYWTMNLSTRCLLFGKNVTGSDPYPHCLGLALCISFTDLRSLRIFHMFDARPIFQPGTRTFKPTRI